ncbi:uncharacterized protein FA14DRAFT_176301 [Meira miltonrushii]|uniref:Uncharacterized protein n=1 Tax=Meira miltonrushii TaxID=1280837 RepID=A0A316VHJ6_9BASI|nr:uncharacterized protein FA14DRAFT_176301 [Meira miltonrushii]PWN37000.1 hypothetical protein FA14DRAFT_176301 [Meira miltonrushii]
MLETMRRSSLPAVSLSLEQEKQNKEQLEAAYQKEVMNNITPPTVREVMPERRRKISPPTMRPRTSSTADTKRVDQMKDFEITIPSPPHPSSTSSSPPLSPRTPHAAAKDIRSIKAIRFGTNVKELSSFAPRMPNNANVPFADGVVASRSRFTLADLPANIAMKMEWPLDVEGYNEERKLATIGNSSQTSLFGGPSLVYYRSYLETRENDSQLTTVKLEKNEDATPGRVLLRAECEAPCWSTSSRRYESPIRIGLGRSGPIIWEVIPITPKSKRQTSFWTIADKRNRVQMRIRGEDVECLRYSLANADQEEYCMYAQTESKIKLVTKESQRLDIAQFDPWDDWGALHIDSRPLGSVYRKREREGIDVAFIVAMFEALNAIQDENTGGGKGRRDSRGRLVIPKKTGIVKVFSRMLKN